MKKTALAVLAAATLPAVLQAQPAERPFGTLREQAVVQQQWLQKRLDTFLPALLRKLSPVDLVLVEGFKRGLHPKLEVYRAANGKPLLAPDDAHIVAIASDGAVPDAKVPVLALDDYEAIADALLAHAAPMEAVTGG